MYENVLFVQLCDDANNYEKSSARQTREYTLLSRQITFYDLIIVICASTRNGSSLSTKKIQANSLCGACSVMMRFARQYCARYHSSNSLVPPVQQLKQASHTISTSRLIILLSRG